MKRQYDLADTILAFDFGMIFMMALIQTIVSLYL